MLETPMNKLRNLLKEMRSEISGNTMPIVHDAATAHWADKIEELISCESVQDQAATDKYADGEQRHASLAPVHSQEYERCPDCDKPLEPCGQCPQCGEWPNDFSRFRTGES